MPLVSHTVRVQTRFSSHFLEESFFHSPHDHFGAASNEGELVIASDDRTIILTVFKCDSLNVTSRIRSRRLGKHPLAYLPDATGYAARQDPEASVSTFRI